MHDTDKKLAILIDADNTRPDIVDGLLAEIANYGIAIVKRIYGNWASTSLNGWKTVLLNNSIQPIQQFAYTAGKNATDIAMIIDAMDLLYTGKFDGFCIVSSDSDFTRLASRIRESGLLVYGFGEQKTPKAFVSACNKFIDVGILPSKAEDSEETAKTTDNKAAARKPVDAENGNTSGNKAVVRNPGNELKRDAKLINLLRNAVDASSDDNGWASLATVGSHIARQLPEFDSRNYGYAKLGDLVAATALFAIEKRAVAGGNSTAIYITDKRKK